MNMCWIVLRDVLDIDVILQNRSYCDVFLLDSTYYLKISKAVLYIKDLMNEDYTSNGCVNNYLWQFDTFNS